MIWPQDSKTILADSLDSRPVDAVNDLVVEKDGVYFTLPNSGTVLYARPGANVIKVFADPVERINGITLKRDERTLYVATSAFLSRNDRSWRSFTGPQAVEERQPTSKAAVLQGAEIRTFLTQPCMRILPRVVPRDCVGRPQVLNRLRNGVVGHSGMFGNGAVVIQGTGNAWHPHSWLKRQCP